MYVIFGRDILGRDILGRDILGRVFCIDEAHDNRQDTRDTIVLVFMKHIRYNVWNLHEY
jgi:hypothetical protein